MSWPAIDERRAAAMCYTSGTTGRPKGVIYSHRALVLHSLVFALPDALGISSRDVILPAVPMFHVNGWDLPFTAALTGAKLVLPGPRLDPVSLLDLLEGERVTFTAGVPTVWMAVLQALDAEPDRWDLRALATVNLGGAAVPASLIEGFERHGLTIIQGWGMTETSPLGTLSKLPAELESLPAERAARIPRSPGSPDPADRDPRAGRRRGADPLGRPGDGRARDPRPVGRGRLPRRHGRRQVHRRRLVPHRRRRPHQRARMHAHLRSGQGSRQVRWRMDLLGRPRERADGS